MIGMNQIKKRLLNGILIGLAIGLVIVIVVIIISSSIVKGYKEGTNKNFLADYTGLVVTFTRDIIQGEKITSDMLQTARVHKSTMSSDAITNVGSAVGKTAKYNIPQNATAVNSMLSDTIIGVDVRIQEINSVVLPTDLAVNDFVDIRIMYPSGIEYIVIAQKQVKKISGTTIWMDLSEEQQLILNGAIVDSFLTSGTKLYAVQYTDPTTQIKIDSGSSELARQYIKEKLGQELADIDIKSTYVSQKPTTTGEIDVYTEQAPATPQITTTEKMVDMMTKYAIEYRYYIESYNKIEANYQPNAQIIAYMQTNKYIVDQAKAKLSATLRQGIEASIRVFENSNAAGYSSVVSGINSSISEQQSLRNGALGI